MLCSYHNFVLENGASWRTSREREKDVFVPSLTAVCVTVGVLLRICASVLI